MADIPVYEMIVLVVVNAICSEAARQSSAGPGPEPKITHLETEEFPPPCLSVDASY